MLRILRITQPEVGNTDAAGEADFPIDDENLPVCAVVQLLETVPVCGIEVDDVAARGTQTFEVTIFHLARTDGIDNDANVDAALRGPLERISELAGDLALFVNVGLEADAFARTVDRLQHCGKHLVAVDQHVIVVAGGEIGGHQRGQVFGGVGVFRCNRAA